VNHRRPIIRSEAAAGFSLRFNQRGMKHSL
jgi:hypothetical protein